MISFYSFDATDSTDSIPFVYVCSGSELDLGSCYQSSGKVCEQTINSTRSNIAIECDSKSCSTLHVTLC